MADRARKLWLVLLAVAAMASGCGGDGTDSSATPTFSASSEQKAVEVELAGVVRHSVPGAKVRCADASTLKLDCRVLNRKGVAVRRYTVTVDPKTSDWAARPSGSKASGS